MRIRKYYREREHCLALLILFMCGPLTTKELREQMECSNSKAFKHLLNALCRKEVRCIGRKKGERNSNIYGLTTLGKISLIEHSKFLYYKGFELTNFGPPPIFIPV